MKNKKENPLNELLKKRIVDLTEAELDQLCKPIGTSAQPFPMFGNITVDDEGKRSRKRTLAVIADDQNPMRIYSERPFNEVNAMLWSDMPVPGMLPILRDTIHISRAEAKNRVIFIQGNPGQGKSHMAGLLGKIASDRGAEIMDCGGKNMRDILFEMVLDFGSGDALPTTIDKKIVAGTLNHISEQLLRTLPHSMWSETADGKLVIDWKAAKHGDVYYTKEQQKTIDAMGDDERVAFESANSANNVVAKVREVLNEVAGVEGIGGGSGNALGMNSQYGKAIIDFIEGRMCILDEYNKSKEGTDDSLQGWLQFCNGERDEITVENSLKNKNADSGPASFTFRREDVRLGWEVVLTGNKSEDGSTTRKLNKSVISRLEPQVLPDPTAADWQHRICQIACGFPVSTAYKMFKEEADKDPDGFADWMIDMRRTKANIEGMPMSELDETLLRNWKRLNDATEKLAEIYQGWGERTSLRKMTELHPKLATEIDEDYAESYLVDFRRVIKDIRKAMERLPQMMMIEDLPPVKFSNWGKPAVLDKKPQEDIALSFGTRITDLMEERAQREAADLNKPLLFAELKGLFEKYGLKDINLQEAAKSEKTKSIEDMLNISVYSDVRPERQARLAQKLFCDYLRGVEPGLSNSDEDIVTANRMRTALEEIKARGEVKGLLTLLNADFENIDKTPFVAGKLWDMAGAEFRAAKTQEEADAMMPSAPDVVLHEQFMAALALPVVGKMNLGAVWDNNLSSHIAETQKDKPQDANANDNQASGKGEDQKMAERMSSTGLATTSFMLRVSETSEDLVAVHVVTNTDKEKTLIVSSAIPARLETAFKEAGIIHVDRDSPSARSRVEHALGDLVRSTGPDAMKHLRNAFGLRNSYPEELSQEEAAKTGKELKEPTTVTEALLDRSMSMPRPKIFLKA